SGARVYFENPTDGAYVKPKVRIRFGLVGMGVAPAGVDKANTGHHHLLIDTALPPLDQPIPNDPNHLHFGAGQTEAEVTLPLGTPQAKLVGGRAKPGPPGPAGGVGADKGQGQEEGPQAAADPAALAILVGKGE